MSYFPDENYWWVISNQRLIILDNGKYFNLLLSEISKVELKDIFHEDVQKLENKSIHIHLNNEVYKLLLEKSTWPIIYEIIKFLIPPSNINLPTT